MRISGPRSTLLWLATLAPAVLIGVLIALNAVDMPYMDDWSLSSGPLVRARTGSLGWADLIAQHNETRPLFPRLAFLALGLLAHGDMRWLLWFNLGLACAVSYAVFRIARETTSATGLRLFAMTFLANLLIFTPKQGETWLTSCAVGFEPIACLSAAVAVLLSGLGGRTKLALAAVLCTVATYSYANGLATWLLAAPLVALVLGGRSLWFWSGALLLNALPYFHGYSTPAHHPRLVDGLQPLRLTHYLLAFPGSPWGLDRVGVATAVGAVLLACFVSAALYLVAHRRDEELWRKMLPWLAIGGYTLASGLMSGIGRSPWGVAMALVPRYVVSASYLAVACLFLVPIVLHDARGRGLLGRTGRRVATGVVAAAVVVILALQAAAIDQGVRAVLHDGRMRRYAKSCLLLINVLADEQCLSTRVYPDTGVVRGLANALDQQGLLHPPLVQGRLPGPRASGEAASESGVFEDFSRTSARRHVAVGWAGSRTKAGPADAVILALEGPQGEWLPWRLVPVERSRPDLARAKGRAYARAGWRRPVPWPELPPRPFRIGAWAFDVTAGQVAPLERTYAVPADDAGGRSR